jgi:hypothetical protein
VAFSSCKSRGAGLLISAEADEGRSAPKTTKREFGAKMSSYFDEDLTTKRQIVSAT